MSSSVGINNKPGGYHEATPAPPLSKPTRILLWVVLPCIFSAVCIASPLTAILSPFLLLPTFGFWWYYERSCPPEKQTDLETFIWTYVLTGTVGIGVVMAIQGILSYLFVFLLFGSDSDVTMHEFARQEQDLALADEATLLARRALTRQPRYWALLVLFCFIIAGLLEESLKYVAIHQARHRGRLTHPRNYITLAVAAGLGFGTIENIGFVHAAVHNNEALATVALTFIERVVGGSLAHAMMAVMTGLNFVRRDVHEQPLGFVRMIRTAALFHGVSNLVLLGISAFEGNVGWVHPRGVLMYVMLGAATLNLVMQGVVVRRGLRAEFVAGEKK